jgi:hypothetical protein
MFKRKLQKWGVTKYATSDKMDRVVESLKRTNERELTQPCPDIEMVVEGQKVKLSQVKRYMRRKKNSLASHADTNDDFPMSKPGTQPQESYTVFLSPEEVADVDSVIRHSCRCIPCSVLCPLYAALNLTHHSYISFRFSTILPPIPFSTVGFVGFVDGSSRSRNLFRSWAAATWQFLYRWTHF